ncbi:hypothetical protein HK102_008020, partial [Quaeritorhiza haematococci]
MLFLSNQHYKLLTLLTLNDFVLGITYYIALIEFTNPALVKTGKVGCWTMSSIYDEAITGILATIFLLGLCSLLYTNYQLIRSLCVGTPGLNGLNTTLPTHTETGKSRNIMFVSGDMVDSDPEGSDLESGGAPSTVGGRDSTNQFSYIVWRIMVMTVALLAAWGPYLVYAFMK